MTVSIYCTNLQNLGTYTNKLIKKRRMNFVLNFNTSMYFRYVEILGFTYWAHGQIHINRPSGFVLGDNTRPGAVYCPLGQNPRVLFILYRLVLLIIQQLFDTQSSLDPIPNLNDAQHLLLPLFI